MENIMSYASSTIKQCLVEIENYNYLMPAIQREFVWKPEQIESLFDSLMMGYPISTFLFWKVNEENISKFTFYKFIKHYHERDKTHNEKYDSFNKNTITAILDGQQRLTSLYIGLLGSYAKKVPYGRKDNNEAFPEKKLYLDLLSGNNNENNSIKNYEFKFLSKDELNKNECVWFEVSKILDFKEIEDATLSAFDYGLTNDNLKNAQRTLAKFWNVIHQKEVIHYYLEQEQSLEKVLQIFIRVNSGGTKLSYSDLLLSIATAEWKDKDAREEINSFVDEIRIHKGFEISKDFVLKSSLVLNDFANIAFSIENFNRKNMEEIEKNWEKLKSALRLTFDTLQRFGLNNDTVSSFNALIPITYYIQRLGNPADFATSEKFAEDRQLIYKWLVRTTIKQTFSGQPDNILKPVRVVISKSTAQHFPLEEIIQTLQRDHSNKSITFESENDFKSILELKYGQPATYLVLALLMVGKNPSLIYHQDHLFPKGQFNSKKFSEFSLSDEEQKNFEAKKNSLANIQLLQGNENQSKSDNDLKSWLESYYPDENQQDSYKREQSIPLDEDLDFKNFLNVINQREKLLIEKLKKLI